MRKRWRPLSIRSISNPLGGKKKEKEKKKRDAYSFNVAEKRKGEKKEGKEGGFLQSKFLRLER